MGDIDGVATAFVQHYYNAFDTNRASLAALYQPHSMLTFEATKLQGAEAIVQKLCSLPFTQCKHQIITCDAQPSPSNGIIVLVSGNLLVDEEQRPQKFSQVFHLMPAGTSYYVFNDMFRLNYG